MDSIAIPSPIDYSSIADIQQDEDLTILQSNPNLKIVQLLMPDSTKKIFCDISTNNIRPYIPKSYRKTAFTTIHNLSHPGIRATQKLVTQRFIWPNINKDCQMWTKACLACQRSKVHRHTHSHLAEFQVPPHRFKHVNIDIVGPLPLCQGYRYLLTMVDRFSRWIEAAPLEDQTANSIAKALVSVWIARFGVPERITSDQGRQFDSHLFLSLSRYLGIRPNTTTAYHPQSNGMIERQHRTLKSALKCHLEKSTSWVDALPIVLLGLRTSLKEELGFSAAEITYGSPICLPGEFFSASPTISYPEFVHKLQSTVRSLRPTPTSTHGSKLVFVSKQLVDCSHVFIYNSLYTSSLQPTYLGPFPVKHRSDKYFDVDVNGSIKRISIDRLKPCFLLRTETNTSQPSHARAYLPPNITCEKQSDPQKNKSNDTTPQKIPVTKSGRHVRFPSKLKDYEL